MRAMWSATAEPCCDVTEALNWFVSRQLRFSGIGESTLAEQAADLLDGSNPTVAPYASLEM